MTCRRCANTGDGAVGPILAGIALPAGKELGRVACRWAASLTTSPAPPTWRTTWRAPACACSRPSACPALRRTPRPTPSWWASSPAPSRPPRAAPRPRAPRPGGGGRGGRRQWVGAQGAQQIYFKYCSTFDSTAQGNIGPVTEALMQALGSDFCIATPAFPDNQRTVFNGYLFVGERLLNESGMQNHPLTPMTDPNLVRVLQAQTTHPVGLIDYRVVAQGEAAIRARMAALRADGVRIAVADAVCNADLLRLGAALKGMPLVTAGSGLAIGLPGNFGLAPGNEADRLPSAQGLQAIVSGSCSVATNQQVMDFIAA